MGKELSGLAKLISDTQRKRRRRTKRPPGPTGPLMDTRKDKLRAILSKRRRPEVKVEQLVADLENLDALRTNRPDWVKAAESQGIVLQPATVAEFFPEQLVDKKNLERMRDGLTALKKTFDRLPPKRRRQLALDAFSAAQTADASADVALQVLFETILNGVKSTITALSKSTPPSDEALQRRAKVAGVAAAFYRHGVSIGVGKTSPFISVCKLLLNVSRATVQNYMPDLQKNLDQLVKDMYGV